MKAKKVYEFVQKKSLKNTIKDDIGIKAKYKKDIEEWFKKWLPNWKINENYIINDNLNIEVSNSIHLGDIKEHLELPDNLTIYGDLYLDRSNITELPKNLKVYGYLSVDETNLKKWPINLYVKGDIYARDLPGDFEKNDDDIEYDDSLIYNYFDI